MIERVIAADPQQAIFYGTRGQIRTKMKMYKEAEADLKKGLQVRPNDIGLNQAMAEVYKGIGDRTMAELFRKKVGELKELEKQLKNDPNRTNVPDEFQNPKPEEPKPAPATDPGGNKPPNG